MILVPTWSIHVTYPLPVNVVLYYATLSLIYVSSSIPLTFHHLFPTYLVQGLVKSCKGILTYFIICNNQFNIYIYIATYTASLCLIFPKFQHIFQGWIISWSRNSLKFHVDPIVKMLPIPALIFISVTIRKLENFLK